MGSECNRMSSPHLPVRRSPPAIRKFWWVAIGVAAVIALVFALDVGHYASLETLKASRAVLVQAYAEQPFGVIGVFLAAYVLATALSIPVATLMTLAGGATFGIVMGTVVVSFASTIGATLAFLTSRYLMRERVQRHFGARLNTINDGVRKDGAAYLLTLRLIPVFPFFAVNLALGLTPLAARTFYWASQLGMLPATIIYVNAGTQLATVNQVSDVVSPALLVSLAMLGLFPWVAKKLFSIVAKPAL